MTRPRDSSTTTAKNNKRDNNQDADQSRGKGEDVGKNQRRRGKSVSIKHIQLLRFVRLCVDLPKIRLHLPPHLFRVIEPHHAPLPTNNSVCYIPICH
mmetsp:Transcript_17729/g.23655  ORF Transcript_17729/g.23655 Transcript_17729/m.23655 type:complete len:97 (+) Transcript_17729:1469-1759(+)